jgi:hypothetical protein
MNIRNKGLAVLAGVGVAGLVGAAAASLDLTSSSLGADANVVASCDTDGIDVNWGTGFNSLAQRFDLQSVELTGVAAACDGLDLEIVITDAADATIATFSGSATSTTTNALLSSPVDAEAVEGIAVVISGPLP